MVQQYPLLLPSSIGMHLADGSFIGGKTKVTAQNSQTVNNKIEVPFGKNKILNESYNQLILSFGTEYDLILRAYNEGLAYRFVTHINKEIIIEKEDAIFNFPIAPKIYFPECDAYYR